MRSLNRTVLHVNDVHSRSRTVFVFHLFQLFARTTMRKHEFMMIVHRDYGFGCLFVKFIALIYVREAVRDDDKVRERAAAR